MILYLVKLNNLNRKIIINCNNYIIMSFFNYILVPILFVIHLAAAYVIPIIATLRSRNNGQRWIIHWVVFILLRLTLFQLFDLLFDGAIYWLLLVAS